MARVVRKTSPEQADWAACINELKTQIGASTKFHLDASEVTVTAADATDLATSLTLVNQLRAVFEFHKNDALALKALDATTMTAPAATDLASAITLANELKADYNVHIASATVHFNADATNGIAASNATDQSSLNTLLNELKTDMNAHMADAPSAKSVRLVSA